MSVTNHSIHTQFLQIHNVKMNTLKVIEILGEVSRNNTFPYIIIFNFGQIYLFVVGTIPRKSKHQIHVTLSSVFKYSIFVTGSV